MIVYCVKDFYLSYKYIAIYIRNVFLTWIYCHVHKQHELDIHNHTPFSRPLYCCPNYYLVDGICQSKKTRARMSFLQCHNKQYIILLFHTFPNLLFQNAQMARLGGTVWVHVRKIFTENFVYRNVIAKNMSLVIPYTDAKVFNGIFVFGKWKWMYYVYFI